MPRACSSRKWVSERDLKAEAGAKEMSRGIIFPPRDVTRMMALRVPFGPVTRTSPVGRLRREEGWPPPPPMPDSGDEGGVSVWMGMAVAGAAATRTVSCSRRSSGEGAADAGAADAGAATRPPAAAWLLEAASFASLIAVDEGVVEGRVDVALVAGAAPPPPPPPPCREEGGEE